MPIDERKLRDILTEHDKDFKHQVNRLQEDFKRHVGVLVDETNRKFDIVSEGHQGLSDKIDTVSSKVDGVSDRFDGLSDKLDVEIASIRKELEEIRMHLFRKADLERLEVAEKRLDAIERRLQQ